MTLTDTVFLERAIELGAPPLEVLRSLQAHQRELQAAGVSVSLFDLAQSEGKLTAEQRAAFLRPSTAAAEVASAPPAAESSAPSSATAEADVPAPTHAPGPASPPAAAAPASATPAAPVLPAPAPAAPAAPAPAPTPAATAAPAPAPPPAAPAASAAAAAAGVAPAAPAAPGPAAPAVSTPAAARPSGRSSDRQSSVPASAAARKSDRHAKASGRAPRVRARPPRGSGAATGQLVAFGVGGALLVLIGLLMLSRRPEPAPVVANTTADARPTTSPAPQPTPAGPAAATKEPRLVRDVAPTRSPSEGKGTEERSIGDEPSDDAPSEDEPSDDAPSEDEPSEDEPSEDEPSENEPSENEAGSAHESADAAVRPPAAPAPRARPATPLMPHDMREFLNLQVGATWRMSGQLKSLSLSAWHRGAVTRTIEAEVTVNGQRYLREVTTFDQHLPGLTTQERLLRVTEEGVYVHDTVANREVRWLELPLARGVAWTVDLAGATTRWSVDPEPIDVLTKAGSFPGCLRLCEKGPNGRAEHFLARGQGCVRSVIVLPTGQDLTIELESFTPGPGAATPATPGTPVPAGGAATPPTGDAPGGLPPDTPPDTPEARALELARGFGAIDFSEEVSHPFLVRRGGKTIGIAGALLIRKAEGIELEWTEGFEVGNESFVYSYEATIGPALEVWKSVEQRRTGPSKRLGPLQRFDWDLGPRPAGGGAFYVWKDASHGRRPAIEEVRLPSTGVLPYGPEFAPALLLAMEPDVDYTFQVVSGPTKQLVPTTFRRAARAMTRRIGGAPLEVVEVEVTRREGRRRSKYSFYFSPETGLVLQREVGGLEYVRADEAGAEQLARERQATQGGDAGSKLEGVSNATPADAVASFYVVCREGDRELFLALVDLQSLAFHRWKTGRPGEEEALRAEFDALWEADEQARTEAEIQSMFSWGKQLDQSITVARYKRLAETTIDGRRAAVVMKFSNGDKTFLLERVTRTRWRIVEIRWDG